MRASALLPLLLSATALASPSLKHRHVKHAERAVTVTQWVQADGSSPTSTSASASSSSSTPPPSTGGGGGGGSTGGTGKYKRLIAFGDNLSDNGNGSCANNKAGNPETIYGFGTWTDGPVAVSYLADLISIPLTQDFAYGHADGGSKFGATIDNRFTKSDAGADDAAAQLQKYTSSPDFGSVAENLHFFWFGNNDVLPWLETPVPHLFFGSGADAGNDAFAQKLAQTISNHVQALVDAGATKIIVPNVYPRHVAPVVATYFKLAASDVQQYGKAIESVNNYLKTNLQQFGDKVIYYDAYNFMLNIYNKACAGGYDGIVHMTPGADICDGAVAQAVPGVSNWDLCQVQGKGDTFYWMQFLDPTSHVHKLVAQDMANTIKAAL